MTMATKTKARKRVSRTLHRFTDAEIADGMREEVQRQLRDNQVPLNVYEGAAYPWQSRSFVYEGVQDVRWDITPQVRTELLRQARNWEKNDPIVKRLISIFHQYTFGPNGLAMIPSTDEEGFNESAGQWWKGFSKFPMLTSQHPLSVAQGVMARRWFIDGEIFAYKTQSPETLRPRLQLVEAQRIGNPGTDRAPVSGNEIVDGVEITDYGRPVAYWVSQKPVGSYLGAYAGSYNTSGLVAGSQPYPNAGQQVTYNRVPAEQMIHLFEPERAEQYRGISHLAQVMRTIHDLYDLKKLEMIAAKDQAETSIFVTNASGQAPTNAARLLAMQLNTQDASGKTVTKQNTMFLRPTLGGRTQYLKTGEDVKYSTSTRPSITTQWYFDYLVRTICAGTGISALLVMPWSLQGTVTRADLDIMAQFFRTKSAVAAAVMRELYVWSMGWAVRYDRSLDGAPSDWAEVTCRPPRSVNVDVGRNSSAVISEYQAGFRSLQDICAEMGHDWRQVIRQKMVEAKFVNDLLKDPKFTGVTREQVVQLIAKQAAAPTKNQAGVTDDLLAAASAEIAGV